jgi:hypothetical protein
VEIVSLVSGHLRPGCGGHGGGLCDHLHAGHEDVRRERHLLVLLEGGRLGGLGFLASLSVSLVPVPLLFLV